MARPLLLLSLAALACAAGPKVDVDRAEDVRLGSFETFSIQEPAGPTGDPAYGPSARRAARESLIDGLRAQGLALTESTDADLLVTVHTQLRGGDVHTDLGVAPRYDVYTRRTGVRTPVADVPLSRETVVVPRSDRDRFSEIDRVDRLVIVDISDGRSHDLLWRGTTRMWGERLSIPRLREHVQAVVAEFPAE